MSCAKLSYLQCLKIIIKIMSTNLVWLIFHRRDLILQKKREIKKDKDILTWKLSIQSDIHLNNQFNSINKIVLIGPIKRIGPMVTLLKEGW